MLEKSIIVSSMTKEDSHKLFIDFKNDKSLFKREEDYKEYKYSFDEIDNYVLNQVNKGYILLSPLNIMTMYLEKSDLKVLRILALK